MDEEEAEKIRFYDEYGMRVGNTNEVPPRIFLRKGMRTKDEVEKYKIKSGELSR